MKLWIEQMPVPILTTPRRFEHPYLIARLHDGHAGFESPDDVEEMAASTAGVSRVELKGDPHVNRIVTSGRKEISRWHDADNGIRLCIYPDLSTDNACLPTECQLPE